MAGQGDLAGRFNQTQLALVHGHLFIVILLFVNGFLDVLVLGLDISIDRRDLERDLPLEQDFLP